MDRKKLMMTTVALGTAYLLKRSKVTREGNGPIAISWEEKEIVNLKTL